MTRNKDGSITFTDITELTAFVMATHGCEAPGASGNPKEVDIATTTHELADFEADINHQRTAWLDPR